MKMIHMEVPNHPEATLEGYILDCEITLGLESERPAIIVCPGGGYVYCSPREGEPIALGYAAMGYHAFILRYSTGRSCAGFTPLEEIDWAIGYLKEHATEWHIHPDKILTCGFSAGGHLALAAGVLAKNKPNGMILGYPVASVMRYKGADFMFQILTGKEDYTDEEIALFDLPPKITKDAPPVFMFATAEDLLTPYGVLAVANKYSELGLGYELHVFQHGPHGMGLGTEVSADGSSQVLNSAFAHWQHLSNEWMKKVYGQPQFEDKSAGRMSQYLAELGLKIKQPEFEDKTKFA